MGIRDKPTAPASPWQNGFAERLIGSIRRECVDHIIVLGEAHLSRILKYYADDYNSVRTHRSLNKDTPASRQIQCEPEASNHTPSLADFTIATFGFRSYGEVDSDRRSGRVRLQTLTLETTMQIIADRPEAPSAIRTNLGAIFASLELSHSTWLITSLSPGSGEKMSKHVVHGGDIAGLLQRFAQLREFRLFCARCGA
jgi:hypothetical protein